MEKTRFQRFMVVVHYILVFSFLCSNFPIHAQELSTRNNVGTAEEDAKDILVRCVSKKECHQKMFAAIYQAYIKPGREIEYREAWNKVARYFIEKRGAIGSCLHRTSDGLWVAYSRWPDKKTRDNSWPGENAPSAELPPEIRHAVLVIKDCLDSDRKIPDLCMEVVDDQFLS